MKLRGKLLVGALDFFAQGKFRAKRDKAGREMIQQMAALSPGFLAQS
jgi:hypothetical protein